MGTDPRISETGVWNLDIQKLQHASRRNKRVHARQKFVEIVTSVIPQDKEVVDLGAGPGLLVRSLIEKGYSAWGIDGTPGIGELTDGMVSEFDLTSKSFSRKYRGAADWALFFEVGEHIPRQYEDQLVKNVACVPKDGLVLSWATFKGTRMSKTGHVNCRWVQWVASRFGVEGFVADEELMQKALDVKDINRSLRRRLLVLRRYKK